MMYACLHVCGRRALCCVVLCCVVLGGSPVVVERRGRQRASLCPTYPGRNTNAVVIIRGRQITCAHHPAVLVCVGDAFETVAGRFSFTSGPSGGRGWQAEAGPLRRAAGSCREVAGSCRHAARNYRHAVSRRVRRPSPRRHSLPLSGEGL